MNSQIKIAREIYQPASILTYLILGLVKAFMNFIRSFQKNEPEFNYDLKQLLIIITISFNTLNMTNPTIESPVKMEYG